MTPTDLRALAVALYMGLRHHSDAREFGELPVETQAQYVKAAEVATRWLTDHGFIRFDPEVQETF